MAEKLLRYIPGTDEFETLDVTPNGTVRGKVTTPTADKMLKAGYQLVNDAQWSRATTKRAAPAPAAPPMADVPVSDAVPAIAMPAAPSAEYVAQANAFMGREPVPPEMEPAPVDPRVARFRAKQQGEVDELMRLSDPNAGAAEALVQSTGLGYAPAVAPQRAPSLEFSGFRGDPANPQRAAPGTSNPEMERTMEAVRGRVAADGAPAQKPALEPAIPVAQAGTGGSGASARIRFSPSGSSRGEKELDAANAKQMEAIGVRTAFEQQEAAAEQAWRDEELKATRRRQAEDAERQALANKKVDAEEATYRTMVADLSNPSGEVDPDRWWNSRDTGQKIAAFASAFLTGFAGRPDVIQQMIQRDIDAQQFNLDRADRNKARALEGQKGLVALARDRFGDAILASRAAETAAAEYWLKIAQREAAGYKGREAEVKKQELTAAAMQFYAEKKEAFRVRAAQLGLQQAELALNVQAAQAKMAGAQSGMAAEQGQAVPLATLTPEQKKRAVVLPGSQGRAVLALSEDAAKALRSQDEGISELTDALGGMLKLRREYGPETLNRNAVSTAKALETKALLALKKAESAGALDAGMVEVSKGIIADTTAWKPGVEAQINSALQTYNQQRDKAWQRYTGQSFGATPSVVAAGR
jgi:hypothetical protein